jgi:Tol biopolymer transport system component
MLARVLQPMLALAGFVVCWPFEQSHAVVTVPQRDPMRSARSARTVDVSADGRFIAFESHARLVAADTDDLADVYVLDRQTSEVTLESSDPTPDAYSTQPRISGDGHYVVFEIRSHLPSGEPHMDVVLRDRWAGTSRMLTSGSQDSSRPPFSRSPVISADGRVVAFSSGSTTLTPGLDANGQLEDVYVLQLPAGPVRRASVTTLGIQPPVGNSILPSLSADGRMVAFASTAPLDATPSTTVARELPVRQVYVRDMQAGSTERISRGRRGHEPDGYSSTPSISADGRYVVFVSDASNLADDDKNHGSDVFLFDRRSETTTLVSRAADGSSENGASANAVISGDGRFVAFQSDAANLVCTRHCPEDAEDINLLWDVFVTDTTTKTTVRVSEDELGGWMEVSAGPSLDASGRVIAFSSIHPIDSADRGGDFDLFIRTLPLAMPTTRRGQ